ncbi:MAG: RteC domain-containing protein [Alistipes indistinctus]
MPDDSGNTNDPPSFKWTATVRDLVELIYALISLPLPQQRQGFASATLPFFEQTFQVKIDSIYHTFSKAKLRKKIEPRSFATSMKN